MTAEDPRFRPEGSDPRLRGPAAGAPGGFLAAMAGAVILVAAFLFSLVVVATLVDAAHPRTLWRITIKGPALPRAEVLAPTFTRGTT